MMKFSINHLSSLNRVTLDVSEKVTTQKQTTISFLLHHNIELSVHPLNCEFFSNISISLFFLHFFSINNSGKNSNFRNRLFGIS
jgi:hypothetical protein